MPFKPGPGAVPLSKTSFFHVGQVDSVASEAWLVSSSHAEIFSAHTLIAVQITEAPIPENYVTALFELQTLISSLDDNQENDALRYHLIALKEISSKIEISSAFSASIRETMAQQNYNLLISFAKVDLLKPENLDTWLAKFANLDDRDDLAKSIQARMSQARP